MTRAPLLLAAPSAWSGTTRGRARALLVLLALLALAAAAIAGTVSDGRSGFALDTGLVEGVRQGGDYYAVAADLVRGDEAPARPVVGIRLPTLPVIAAGLPVRVAMALVAALALATALAWYDRLAPALAGRAARIVAAVLLLASVGGALRPDAVVASETWAGLLIALSLARWRPRAAAEAIGWAFAAMLIDERAALGVAVMASFAWAGGARREAAGWLIALVAFGPVLLAHRHAVAVAGIVFADGPPAGATGLGGALADLAAGTALAAGPLALGAVAAVLGLAGWSAWRDPLAARVAVVAPAFVALGAGSAAGSGGALLAAPLALAGLVFLPDGVRDLARAALDTRRIVVRRVAR